MIKPGYRTTEFWTTIAAIAGTIATLLFGPGNVSTSVQTVVAAGGALVVAIYTGGRTTLKAKALVAATTQPPSTRPLAPPAPAQGAPNRSSARPNPTATRPRRSPTSSSSWSSSAPTPTSATTTC